MNMNRTVGMLRKAWPVGFLTAALVVAGALDFLNPWPVRAEDTRIATILADPKEYLARRDSPKTFITPQVSLKGTVQDPKMRGDLSLSGQKECRQYFHLADDTGTIAAYYGLQGDCDEIASQKKLILSAGERIAVDATLGYSGLDGKGNPIGIYLKILKLERS